MELALLHMSLTHQLRALATSENRASASAEDQTAAPGEELAEEQTAAPGEELAEEQTAAPGEELAEEKLTTAPGEELVEEKQAAAPGEELAEEKQAVAPGEELDTQVASQELEGARSKSRQVGSVVGERLGANGDPEYLVVWKGEDADEPTWEVTEALKAAGETSQQALKLWHGRVSGELSAERGKEGAGLAWRSRMDQKQTVQARSTETPSL